MFDHITPKLPGRQTLSKIKNIQGDGIFIVVGNSDGSAGDPLVYFTPPNPLWMHTLASDYNPYYLGSPAFGLLVSYEFEKCDVHPNSVIRYILRGYFTDSLLSVDIYLDGNYVISAQAGAGAKDWQIDIDVFIIDKFNTVIAAKATASDFFNSAIYSDALGNMLPLNYKNPKIIDVAANDPVGSGGTYALAMTAYLQPAII